MKTIMKNISKALGVAAYLGLLIFAYTRMKPERLVTDIEIFAGTFLVIGLLVLERAYKKEDGKLALTSIELLILAFHSLSIDYVITRFGLTFQKYLIASSIVFGIYYILKGIICYTKEKKAYLKGLSDISEIVKDDEPIKKEAKKRKAQSKPKELEEKAKVNKNSKKENKLKTEKDETSKKTKQSKSSKNVKPKKEVNKDKKKVSKNGKEQSKNKKEVKKVKKEDKND